MHCRHIHVVKPHEEKHACADGGEALHKGPECAVGHDGDGKHDAIEAVRACGGACIHVVDELVLASAI